jgi:hypothetical protein
MSLVEGKWSLDVNLTNGNIRYLSLRYYTRTLQTAEYKRDHTHVMSEVLYMQRFEMYV